MTPPSRYPTRKTKQASQLSCLEPTSCVFRHKTHALPPLLTRMCGLLPRPPLWLRGRLALPVASEDSHPATQSSTSRPSLVFPQRWVAPLGSFLKMGSQVTGRPGTHPGVRCQDRDGAQRGKHHIGKARRLGSATRSCFCGQSYPSLPLPAEDPAQLSLQKTPVQRVQRWTQALCWQGWARGRDLWPGSQDRE